MTFQIENDITHLFARRDKVEVWEGEYENIQGEIIAINGNFITIMPEGENKEPIEFFHSKLIKYFKEGDEVKVRYNIIRNF